MHRLAKERKGGGEVGEGVHGKGGAGDRTGSSFFILSYSVLFDSFDET